MKKWEDYFYKGTTVLKNKVGIKDQKRLDVFEKQMTADRIEELKQKPFKTNFDKNRLKDTHEYIFQDIYEWAGQNREVDFGKNLSEFRYFEIIDQKLDHVFDGLQKKTI